MATDKQIRANRHNGSLSRGPKTAAGKARSKYNALKHGFAARPVSDASKLQEIESFARALEHDTPPEAAHAIAQAEIELRQIRKYQAHQEALLSLSVEVGIMGTFDTSDILNKLVKSDRYERRAYATQRRALQKIREAR